MLNKQVATLMEEKESILAMKVSHLGLKPEEDDTIEEKMRVKIMLILLQVDFLNLHKLIMNIVLIKYRIIIITLH